MMHRSNPARKQPIVSDEQLRNVLRRHIHRALHISRTFTRAQLAEESGVGLHHIDAVLTSDPAKTRRLAIEDAFSLAITIGDDAVSALLAQIGWVGNAADCPRTAQPMAIAAAAMGHLAVIARNAADGHIDHTEEPETTHAADMLIAEVLPLSSAGKAQ